MNPTRIFGIVFSLIFVNSLLAQQPSQNTSPSEKQPDTVVEAQFSPDGKRLVTKSADNTPKVWDAQTGKPISGQPPHWGTWQLVSFKYGETNKWLDAPSTQKKIKLITDSYFNWVQYEVSSGKVQGSAGGPYTMSGGNYTETIEFVGEGMTDYLGKKQSFTIRVEGDKLHQSGQLSDGLKIEEVWQRVK
jgi:hypothetical protein